ncbi:hypothetical protein [Singulisphaera sp. PoT]|uniref:hypothetical protein n=1 Tax=Singulisphaera sp. PoT TaxID=3411797 RepID=UPI003BF5708D
MTDSTIPAPGASPCEIRTFRSTTRPLPVWFRLIVVSPGYGQLVALGPIAVAVTIPSLGRIGGTMLIAGLGGMMEGVGRVLARCL